MRQSEFKKLYDVKMWRYVKKHIYGECVTNVFKTIDRKLFGKTVKEAAKSATKKAVQTAATKTGEYVGDKVIQLLNKKNKNTKTPVAASPIQNPQTRELSDYEINERANHLLSGGRTRNYVIY